MIWWNTPETLPTDDLSGVMLRTRNPNGPPGLVHAGVLFAFPDRDVTGWVRLPDHDAAAIHPALKPVIALALGAWLFVAGWLANGTVDAAACAWTGALGASADAIAASMTAGGGL